MWRPPLTCFENHRELHSPLIVRSAPNRALIKAQLPLHGPPLLPMELFGFPIKVSDRQDKPNDHTYLANSVGLSLEPPNHISVDFTRAGLLVVGMDTAVVLIVYGRIDS